MWYVKFVMVYLRFEIERILLYIKNVKIMYVDFMFGLGFRGKKENVFFFVLLVFVLFLIII